MLTLPLRRPTTYELRTCDRYHLTSGHHEWAPQTLNGGVLTSEHYATQASTIDERVVNNCNISFSSYLRRLTVTPSQNDWTKYQSYLLDCTEETTKRTLECTTRLAMTFLGSFLQSNIKNHGFHGQMYCVSMTHAPRTLYSLQLLATKATTVCSDSLFIAATTQKSMTCAARGVD